MTTQNFYLSPHEIVWLCKHEQIGGWDEAEAITATAIFLTESAGGRPFIMARSTVGDNLGQRDHGLIQASGRWQGDKIKWLAERGYDWRDPVVAVWLARWIYDRAEGWMPWKVYTSGSYKTYLPDAEQGAKFPFPPATPWVTRFDLSS